MVMRKATVERHLRSKSWIVWPDERGNMRPFKRKVDAIKYARRLNRNR